VLFTAAAHRDLASLVETIAADRPRAARAMRDRIVERCGHLAEHPHRGTPQHNVRLELRGSVVGPYWIFYTAAADGIRVIRILHGRRDCQALLR